MNRKNNNFLTKYTFWLIPIHTFINDTCRLFHLIFSFTRFLPESVLWLINKNKIEEAKKTLQKIARFNRKTLTDEDLAILQKSNVNGTEKYSFYHLVKTPAMRKRTLLMCYLWYVILLIGKRVQKSDDHHFFIY